MKKEQLQIGDVIQLGETKAFVDKKLVNKIRVWINNERTYIPDNELENWKYANPIEGNRIVSSYTFAVRFKQFLKWIPKNWWMSQPHYFEEYEYMMDVADRLLKYQIQTATDENEINYLKRLNLK